MTNTKSNSLFKNTFIYAVGNFGSKILSFLLVPLYSFYLNKEEFGYFDLVVTSVSLIVPFFTLQISDSVFRWLLTSKGDLNVASKTISNGFFLILCNGIIISSLSLLLYIVHPIKDQFIITLLCLNAMFYPFFQQIARGLGKNKLFAFNGLFYTTIYLIANLVLLLIFKLSIEALFYSTILAYFLSSIFLIFKLKIWCFFKFNTVNIDNVKELAAYSLPLIPNTISWWLISSVNKYLILIFLGVSANGLFAMSNRFPVILVMVNQVFTLAWQEAAIINYDNKEKKQYYTGIIDMLIRIQFSLIVLLSLISQFIVSQLISREYYEAWIYMPVLYLSVAFLSFSGFYGALYMGVKQTREIFTTTVYGSLVNIIAGFVLIKYFGLMGIAIATCLGYGVLFTIRVFKTKTIIDFSFPCVTFIKYSVIVIASFIVVYLSSSHISLISLLIFVPLLLFDNRKVISGNVVKFIGKLNLNKNIK
jgi:O-antigen/teichoic acid export membrane protein